MKYRGEYMCLFLNVIRRLCGKGDDVFSLAEFRRELVENYIQCSGVNERENLLEFTPLYG